MLPWNKLLTVDRGFPQHISFHVHRLKKKTRNKQTHRLLASTTNRGKKSQHISNNSAEKISIGVTAQGRTNTKHFGLSWTWSPDIISSSQLANQKRNLTKISHCIRQRTIFSVFVVTLLDRQWNLSSFLKLDLTFTQTEHGVAEVLVFYCNRHRPVPLRFSFSITTWHATSEQWYPFWFNGHLSVRSNLSNVTWSIKNAYF